MLIGKILLLKATILSKLDEDDECESAFKKALMYNSGKFKKKSCPYKLTTE